MARKINLPLTEELAKTLHAGDEVLLTGTIYTSRDAGHKRMCESLAKGEPIPFDPKDATIYYVGPTPAKPGKVIGSAGPTTSGRMDAYAPTMMSVGARGMIGKNVHLGACSVVAGVLEPPSATPVVIEDDVVIGANCVILEGVRVGKGAVIAAGSVVTKDVEPNTVVAGSPAKIVKYKDEQTSSKTQILSDLRKLD